MSVTYIRTVISQLDTDTNHLLVFGDKIILGSTNGNNRTKIFDSKTREYLGTINRYVLLQNLADEEDSFEIYK